MIWITALMWSIILGLSDLTASGRVEDRLAKSGRPSS